MKVCKVCSRRKVNKSFPVILPGMFGMKDMLSTKCSECWILEGKDPTEEWLKTIPVLLVESMKYVKEIKGE